jgi:hypothetical protein
VYAAEEADFGVLAFLSETFLKNEKATNFLY